MCGLGGLARIDGRDLDGSADVVLATMARTLAHRGPDAEELLRDGPVGLAFTRLSLVDPEGGGQPLISPDGSIVLIANGEVYNHRALAAGLPAGGKELRGGSDCEVLVHLYQEKGLSFLDDVRGMFGLVLWDRRRNVLVMARDHFGVKPLYFSRNRERVVFASEIKALFSDPDCPRQVAWDEALASPTLTASPALDTSAPTTWFEGVESVPAATIIEIDLADGTTREHLYWTAPDFMGDPACATRDDRDIIAEFRELLADSVRDCATADVSIGLFLSGGVDSAAVAALAADTASLETFTVLNGSTVANGDARFARRVADELGVPNHQILFEASHVPSAAEWKRLLWLTEMPTCGPEQYYKHELHRHVRAHHPGIKGMLLGAAADEFCGGYSVQTSGDRGWEGFMEALGDMDRRGRLQSGRHALDIWWEGSEAGLLSEAALGLRHDGWGRDPYALFVAAKMRDVAQYNCWHEDRTAAGSGIEARVPFLDRRLFELVASIPPHRRERLLWDKAIVREAVAGLLPQDVVHRPKVPFFYGEGVQHTHRTFISMLTQDGCALLDEALESPRGKEFLNADRVRAVLCRLEQAPLSGEVERILPLINLCLLDRMAAESPSPPIDSATVLPPVREEYPVDGESGVDDVVALTTGARRWDGHSRLALADDAVLLRDTDETWYVAVDGSLEYVLDHEEPWLAFLRGLDGTSTVHQICERAGTTPETLSSQLTECLDLGLLVPVTPAPVSTTLTEWS
ncbi:asparagine synthase (glutamine-hydrolyzing) [Streptomyces mirabilis]|uniref:asparagine synthase (glutamine-hydrolyzing) n=1 Tax=Streptomyces mirabilis TaxID=68239 RepID=UPI002E34E2A2|nr:asparagine synthase (glutamine-hydrolyzing) [Streptomyces mirabilis]